MKPHWIILGGTGTFALGFIGFLVVQLVRYESHKGRSPAADATGRSEDPADGSDGGAPAPSTAPTPEDFANWNLRHLLSRLSYAAQPSSRQEILDEARRRLREYERPLLRILGNEWDHLIPPALQLAATLNVASAVPQVTALANAKQVPIRVTAMLAREILQPWPDADVVRFLEESDPRLLHAALRLVQRRDQRPVPRLIELLGHGDASVRDDAAAAFPKLAPGRDLDALCRLAESSDGSTARAAAQALGRTGFGPKAERTLIAMLQRDDGTVRRAALAALGNKATELEDLEPLFECILDDERELNERTGGFLAMERTRTIPTSRIRGLLPQLHPVLRLFAARCLVTAGDPTGIRTLIDLLETEETESVDSDTVGLLIDASRQVLTELAGEDLGRRVESWRQWQRRHITRPTSLEAPGSPW